MRSFLVFLFLLFLGPRLVFASASLNGATGLIEMPTAMAIEYQAFNFALDTELSKRSTQDSTIYQYKINIGSIQNLELGVVGGTVPSEGVFVNAKYFLMSDESRFPLSIAVGIQNLGSHSLTDAYLVASKKFDQGWYGHFGFKATFNDELDASAMLGAEYIMNDQVSFLGDLVGEKKVYKLNVGARFYVTPDFDVRFFILDVGRAHSEETIYTLGLSFTRFM